jgi:hypothetical protein
VQALANALIYGAAGALFIGAFRSVLSAPSWALFALFSLVVFALPWTWGTTLDGFNVQYYFLELFSIAALIAIAGARAFAPRWWLAVLLLLGAYLSLAGGATAAIAAFGICAAQLAAGSRRGVREWAAVVAVGAAAALLAADIPVHPDHVIYKAHSVWLFLLAMAEILSWPAATGLTFPPTLVVLALVTYMPSWLASVEIAASRPPRNDRRWLLVAFTGWMMLQIASVAYARGAVSITARYIDMYAFGLPLNAACLLYLLEAHPHVRRRLVVAAVALWLVPVCAGITVTLVNHTRRDLADARRFAAAQTQNVRDYLETGDIRTLQNKGEFEIPHAEPATLARIVTQPLIRAVLPPALVGEPSAKRAQQQGIARYTGPAIETVRDIVLRYGFMLIPFGFAIFVAGVGRTQQRQKVSPANAG